jgi:uncharacterized SAM-dependent methyltransferase
LYDERGSALFEEITRQDEYYLTRAETSILRERQSDIADFVESDAILIEYGARGGVKTELVLAGLRGPRGYSAGVMAAFYLNLLERINTDLGGDFRLEQFEHAAHWNAIEKAVDMHLVSLCDQRAILCGRTFHFRMSKNHPQ